MSRHTIRKTLALPLAAFLCCAGSSREVVAQTAEASLPSETGASSPKPGWSFTPSLAYGGGWDDNVLIKGQDDDLREDFVNTVRPEATFNFEGRRGGLTADYGGAFALYREFHTLNSFDQQMAVSANRLLTKHTELLVSNTFRTSPTTDVGLLSGTPFVRTGSLVENLRAGVQTAFSKYTTASASYVFDLVDFDTEPTLGVVLIGGHSHGASLSVRRDLNERTTLTAAYDLQRATVGGAEGFNVHNAWGGAEHRISPRLRVSGELGLSHLSVTTLAPSETAPAWRAGLSTDFPEAIVQVGYSRSFTPSYSFGGTQQNEELGANLLWPLTGRYYTRSSFSLRTNDALGPGNDDLRSALIAGNVGYVVRRWMRVEGFYEGTFQTIERPGGRLSRNRAGFQIVTAQPMRIR